MLKVHVDQTRHITSNLNMEHSCKDEDQKESGRKRSVSSRVLLNSVDEIASFEPAAGRGCIKQLQQKAAEQGIELKVGQAQLMVKGKRQKTLSTVKLPKASNRISKSGAASKPANPPAILMTQIEIDD
jgi:hypothetical protein